MFERFSELARLVDYRVLSATIQLWPQNRHFDIVPGTIYILYYKGKTPTSVQERCGTANTVHILTSKSPVLSHQNQEHYRPIVSFSLAQADSSLLQQLTAAA